MAFIRGSGALAAIFAPSHTRFSAASPPANTTPIAPGAGLLQQSLPFNEKKRGAVRPYHNHSAPIFPIMPPTAQANSLHP